MTDTGRWLAMLAVAVVMLMVWSCRPAGAVSWCPTKAEAQRAHPGAWLYWHSAMRCWDARRHNDRHWPLNMRATAAPRNHARAPRPTQPELTAEEVDLETSYWPPLWPDVKIKASFAMRWPDEGGIRPDTWLRELIAFGAEVR